jgi:hypothetical protein
MPSSVYIGSDSGESRLFGDRRLAYLLSENNPYCEPHKAITLVTAYLVERGLILKPEEVENKSNEITAVPKLIETLAVEGVVFAFDAINTPKND